MFNATIEFTIKAGQFVLTVLAYLQLAVFSVVFVGLLMALVSW